MLAENIPNCITRRWAEVECMEVNAAFLQYSAEITGILISFMLLAVRNLHIIWLHISTHNWTKALLEKVSGIF